MKRAELDNIYICSAVKGKHLPIENELYAQESKEHLWFH
jgi:hypothetical protein